MPPPRVTTKKKHESEVPSGQSTECCAEVVRERDETEVALIAERERMRAGRRAANAAEQEATGASTTPPVKAQEAVVASTKASEADNQSTKA